MKVRFLALAQRELDDARFPYELIYGLDDDAIVVVAVAHLHREPRYWLDRMK